MRAAQIDRSDRLSQADVMALLDNRTAERRAATAVKVARELDNPDLAPAEQQLVHDIVRLLARDIEVRVRRALADSAKASPRLPHDVAVRLARDVIEVAEPVLRHSPVLDDRDLIKIIAEASPAALAAIAHRASVSETVSGALLQANDPAAARTVFANSGAQFAPAALRGCIDTMADDEQVVLALARREALPLDLVEHMVAKVSERVRDELLDRHQLPAGTADDLVVHSRERVTLGYRQLPPAGRGIDILVNHLHGAGRLTGTIVLRALCLGDLPFYEFALARLAEIPVENVRALLRDRGSHSARALHARCDLPPKWLRIVSIAMDVAQEQDFVGAWRHREAFRDRLTARVLDEIEDKFDGDILPFLIENRTV